MWPVLPNGEVNENFDWPIQGSLIPNSPPLEKPSGNPTDSYVPVKLKVLKNGDWDKNRACTIVGPNISSMLKKTGAPSSSKKQMKQKEKKVSPEEDHSIKVEKIEFQQFLERCTMMMNLPSAARRLFNQNGDEIFHLRDVERNQLVYVSCGDHWIDPQLSAAERKKQLLLNNLGSDVSLIRYYCSLQSPDNLVLEVCGEIVAGAKLTVNHNVSVANEDDAASAIDEGKVAQTEESVQENDTDDILDSHTRTHRRLDALFTGAKYPWEETPEHYDEDNNIMPEDDLVNSHQQDNCGYKRKVTKLHGSHRQQFELVDGQIICSAVPGLALGVSGEEVHAGVEVILVDRRPDDINQQWKYVEDNRTFHLESNPDLVLAISTPKVYPGLKQTDTKYPRCSTILQKYKEYINGAANQKWCYVPSMKVLGAFFSDQLDKEITAANQASVCTFTITGAVELSQPGYSLISPDGNENITVCLPCARTMGGQRDMKKVPADTTFFCASGLKDSKLSPLGPFKCLHVRKTDLSTSEAQNTLRCFEETLSSLVSERATHTISREISAVGSQRALRFKAYKNGSGFQNGKLIIAGTLPMLLTMCTKELDLPRPVSKLYTEDGTLILTWSNLILWAVNDFFQKNEEQIGSSDAEEDPQPVKERTDFALVGPEDLNMIDEHLLSFILRKPVEVWASCGEPFLSLHALQRSQERERLHWLQKEKILTDLNGMKHKIRHLQGRRVKSLTPPRMVSNQNPSQPVLVEGGWTEETNEERKLLKNIHNAEMYLSDVQALHLKKQNVPSTTKESGQRALYTCPAMKRVSVYVNGGNEEQAIFAWGKTMEEMLDNCTSRLNMQLHPAEAFYTPDGEKVTSWDDVIKDMVLCVSSGEPFVSYKAKKHMIQVKANYARIRRRYGSEATDVIVSSPKGMESQLA
ncbi:doublecortin domain-containing protein 1-like [Spea bombifrons]|uniref:doublecortin domain-containing protein 1-like n=1 Tax=Spea bombifrons TaxID=233779 RepID=UPI00234A987B|nr:doublecortin domain-containing protein 1-like [Spea bombifrons]